MFAYNQIGCENCIEGVVSMKIVFFHIDVNSAFLSWTAAYRLQHGETLDLRTIPSVIGGNEKTRHGIVLAKSIPAKKFGIKTGESLMEVRQKSGDRVMIVPPDYRVYSMASKAFINILKKYSPVVEKFSIDEAFVDYTGMEKLLGDPVECACRIKDEIKDTLGFTVNVGISTNKLLAKMASEFQKPDKAHTLWPCEIEKKMWSLPISELYMVGRKMSIHLRRKGIYTIGDLASMPVKLLEDSFNSFGNLLWRFANGDYYEEGTGGSAFFQGMMTHNDKHKIKGIGNSGTMPIDVTELAVAHQALLSISETVGYRLRKHGFSSKNIHVGFTTSEFERCGKQHKFGSYTNITSEIYIRACQLFDELWDGNKRIRQLGVRASDLVESNDIQGNFFSPIEEQIKNQKVDFVIDNIREKYGNHMILRGRLYNGVIDPMIGGTWGTGSWRPKGGMPG